MNVKLEAYRSWEKTRKFTERTSEEYGMVKSEAFTLLFSFKTRRLWIEFVFPHVFVLLHICKSEFILT